MKNQNKRVGKVKNRALAQRWLLTDSNNSVHLSHDRRRARCAANLLPALGGQGRRRRRRLRNRRGVASPREEEEEEDGAGDDWPGRRSAVYCAAALPGTYVGTRELDAGAAARIANSCACAVDPPAIELLMGEATREESAARCRRSDIRSRQHVAETY